MENFELIQFAVVLILASLIVFLLKKMSGAGHYKFGDHYRCTNNFYHYFDKEYIEYTYGKNTKVYLCPKSGCGGILKLYEEITDEEYAELQHQNFFED
jgi:hypothetical protein